MSTLASVIQRGTAASIPAASIPGRMYYTTDTLQVFRDNGTSWDNVTAYVYVADTGTANAYAVSLTPAPTIVAGSLILMKAANANTGASTIAVNGGTTVAITRQGSTALVGGEIAAGQLVLLVYDGTEWQLLNPVSNPMTTAGDLIVGGANGSLTRLAAGTTGFVLTAQGPASAPIWNPSSGGGGSSWQYTTGNYTAAAGNLLLCTGASGQAITLPASPSVGNYVAIRVALGGTWSNAVTVNGNGSTISSGIFSGRTSIRLGLEGQEVWFVYNGTNWYASSPGYGGVVYLTPKVADFTWLNQGTATATDTALGLVMADTQTGQPSQRILYKAVSGSFTNFLVKCEHAGKSGNYTNNGSLLLNSSNAFVIGIEQVPTSFYVGRFNSPTSNNSFPVNNVGIMGPLPWRKYNYDGTNINYSAGKEPTALSALYSETLAAFLTTINSVGLGVDGGATGDASVLFQHFDQW